MTINAPLALLVAVLIVYDFRSERDQRISEKRISLEEEAKAILPAVLQVRHHGLDDVQLYIDSVCGNMADGDSPGHHIAVSLAGRTLQAKAHHRASPMMMDALRQAASSSTARAFAGQHEMIAGVAQQDDVTVYVAEDLAPLRQSVWNDLRRRVAGLFILAFIAAGALNIVLIRLVTVPLNRLVAAVRRIAAGQLGVQSEGASCAELRFLNDEVNAMSLSLAEADKYRAFQMAKARDIQQHVLPKARKLPKVNVATVFEPADEVGGDYYDIIPLQGNRVLVCLADVTGHGVSAAMSTMLLRALLHTAVEFHTSPAAIMDFMNRRFVDATLVGEFATVMIVQLDLDEERLEYVSAGHETGAIISPEGHIRGLESTGLVLGLDEEVEYESRELNCKPGDRILLMTDGVTETHDRDSQMFGWQRAVQLIRGAAQQGIDESAIQFNETLKQFRGGEKPHDDVTIVLLEVNEQRTDSELSTSGP